MVCRRVVHLASRAIVVVLCVALMRTTLLLHKVWSDCSPSAGGYWLLLNTSKAELVGSHMTFLTRDVSDSQSLYMCNSSVRPLKSAIRNGVWHIFANSNSSEYLIYSAFYDDRPDVGLLPVIRLLVVASVANISLYCQVWYDSHPLPYVTATEQLHAGRGDKVNGIFYSQKMLTCPLVHSRFPPQAVSLTALPCDNASIIVPVIASAQSHTYSHQFGVCVAISFGHVDEVQLIEWVEFHRMFGITEFNIYNSTLTPNKAFDYYQQLGILRIFAMPPPVNDFSKKGVKLASPASLSDCMLRNMYRYEYMLTIDFDEFIVPKMATSYDMLLRQVDRVTKHKEHWLSYSLRNVFFFSEFDVDITAPAHLRTARYRWRVATSRYLHAAKSFVDPRRCLSVFNHFCLVRFASAPTRGWSVDVSESLATCQHYRSCMYDSMRCASLYMPPSTLTTLWRGTGPN
jgi:hypothetical protein